MVVDWTRANQEGKKDSQVCLPAPPSEGRRTSLWHKKILKHTQQTHSQGQTAR